MYTAKTRRQRRKSHGINAGVVTLRFAECCRRKKISLTARGVLDGGIGELLVNGGGRVGSVAVDYPAGMAAGVAEEVP